MDSRYRHKCTDCGRSRSKSFHKEFPAGPSHPEMKGVCRRCRGDAPITHVHHHHHHYFHRSDHSITGRASSRVSSLIFPVREPPPEYDKFPTRRDSIHDSGQDRTVAIELPTQQEVYSHSERAELAAINPGDIVRNTRAELPANHEVSPYRRAVYLDHIQEEKPPQVGPKPSLRVFLHSFTSR